MSRAPAELTADVPEHLLHIFHGLRDAQAARVPDFAQRDGDLKRLRAAVAASAEQLAQAVDADFGGRSRFETQIAEISMILHDIDVLRSGLRRWMRPRRVSTDWKFLPARSEIHNMPLGVVGVLSPWNYPLSLALMPLAAAIAAGNHVLVKPSEHTPATAAALRKLLAEVFPQDRVAVVEGGPELAAAVSTLPLDHLFFTGSTAIGRRVMLAAAANLTPVTLELGGKSPTLIAPDFDLDYAAARIAAMKFLNAGQTCIAPDFVMVERGQERRLAQAIVAQLEAAYGDPAGSEHYTSVINARQYDRLQQWLDEAVAGGAELIQVGSSDPQRRRLAPTLVLGAPPHSALMQEEIFGPVLPILPYDDFQSALAHVRAQPRPLAYYQFDRDSARVRASLAGIVAGGVCINDCALHFAQPALPFGGVGPSGMGHYHGEYGLRTFSKAMPVFHQARFSGIWLLKPPYGKLARAMVRWLSR